MVAYGIMVGAIIVLFAAIMFMLHRGSGVAGAPDGRLVRGLGGSAHGHEVPAQSGTFLKQKPKT